MYMGSVLVNHWVLINIKHVSEEAGECLVLMHLHLFLSLVAIFLNK